MKYDELFKVNKDGIGYTVTGLPCQFTVDEEDRVISLTIHYGTDLQAVLNASEDTDISALLLHLLLVVPSRPCRPYRKTNESEIVGEMVKAFCAKGMKDIKVISLDSPYGIGLSAMSKEGMMCLIHQSDRDKTCSFSITAPDGNMVVLDFSRALDIRFGQFVECFE